VVHLVSTVDMAIQAAGNRPWAFSDDNAGARYTQFSSELGLLPTFVNWSAVRTDKWSGHGVDPAIKSKKMAEFLVHDSFPWAAVAAIGVSRDTVASDVQKIVQNADHQPQIIVKTNWYY
jgi:hypothetical protein